MYHCKLNIHIFSHDLSIETELKRMAPPDHFEHHFQTYDTINPDVLQNCAIAIFDLPIDQIIEELFLLYENGCYLILCSQAELLADLQKHVGQIFEDFWIKPLFPSHITARFQKLLAAVKLRKDYQITQTYLESTINSVPDLIWFKDIRGSHLKVNDAFCHAVGKTKADVEGRGHYYIWDIEREDYEKGEYVCLETEEIVLRERKTCLFDEKVKSKHGMRQFKTYKSPIFDEDGEVLGTVGIAHDVTDLENIGTELEIVLRSMPFSILINNIDGTIINTNEKFNQFFHIKPDDIIGTNYAAWKNEVLSNLSDADEEGYAEALLMISGEQKTLEIHEEPIFDIFKNRVGQLCICRDVTIERALEQQILYNSNTDFMTGLYNRRYFYEYISQNREVHPISLIYVDLDYFKQINDTYGHQTGDEALILTAKILKECFPDAFITRLGGDEFLVTIIGPCSIRTLKELAQHLLDQMHLVFRSSKQLNTLSASIGIAQTSDPTMKIDVLIQQSDIALYAAKQHGRSQYCVYPPSDDALSAAPEQASLLNE